jgi:hypothetical protein
MSKEVEVMRKRFVAISDTAAIKAPLGAFHAAIFDARDPRGPVRNRRRHLIP